MLEASLLAMADVVESMSSPRPYNPALGIDKAIEEITCKEVRQFDADVVDVCLKLFRGNRFHFEEMD